MRVKLFPLFVVCLMCAFTVAGQTVDESRSSIVLNDTTAEVSLIIDNSFQRFGTEIKLELLDHEDRIRANAVQSVRIKKGKQTYKITMLLGDLMKTNADDVAWYRLRYHVGDRQGVISLSELLKDIFDLRVAASGNVFAEQNYRVRVRAIQPFTKEAVRKVKVRGELILELDTDSDEDELKLLAEGETDGDGFAVLEFRIPEGAKLDSDGDLKIVGKKNGITREIEEDLDSDEASGSVLVSADKPLYQPGQDFNIRGLYFDRNNTVVSGAELEFTIRDEDDTVLFRETVKTSDFGIAAVAWKIPDNAKLGSYRVEIDNDDADEVGSHSFKVSRYDLPNFTVAAKPDKTFYLPNESRAEVAVSADYLFGKPVTQGKVRVVREEERRWNYREQKYETKEVDAIEGAADAEGKFIAKFDLSAAIADLEQSSWQRYRDLNFAAYFTDLTTNRTEQRRFDIRLSKEPIHIYLIRNYSNNPNLPVKMYVSTFYADGKPAVCNVEVSGKGNHLTRFRTNSLGAGKMEFSLPREIAGQGSFDIKLLALDKNKQTGTFEENLDLDTDDAIQIVTEKAIFKPGESIRAEIISTKKDGFVYFDIVKNWTVIESRFIKIEDGRGEINVPYDPNFKGDLILSAYGDEDEGNYYWSLKMRTSRGIIFPEQQNLKLEAEFSKAVYKPSEDAKVKFSVLDGTGKPAESALGIVVFDKAIEERARTDAEFGSYFSRYYGMLGYSRSFGGITLKDLNDLNLSKPISAELQLAAEVMLADTYYYPRIFHSSYDRTEAKSVYAEFFKKQFAPLETALKKQYEKNYEHPTDMNSLKRILAASGIDFESLRDPWGVQYDAVFSVEKAQNIVTINTAGADKTRGSKDDFAVSSSGFTYFTPLGKKVGAAVAEYHKRTGNYIRDLPSLAAELAGQDTDLSKIKDRWGRDYRVEFKVMGRNYQIVFRSNGANGYYEPNYWNSDDFEVWTSSIDYFIESQQTIDRILGQNVNAGRRPFPKDEAEFTAILKENGLDIATVRDGFGQPVYVLATRQTRFADKMTIENGKQKITPVTEDVITLSLRSSGPDRSDPRDDLDLASYSGVLNERSKDTAYLTKDIKTVAYSGANGAIRGTVFDANGAVIPNASVTATNEEDNAKIFSAATNEEGVFLLQNIPSGTYKVKLDATGFKTSVYTGIQVRSQSLVEMRTTLEVGGVSEVVAVSGAAEVTVNSTDASISTNITRQAISDLPKGTQFSSLLKMKAKGRQDIVTSVEENSTPRLREYFPETLLWRPEVITDKNGRAEVSFKMADNITTWKMYTVASTKKGKVGVAEKEITAFQSFFIDLDPPKFLTEGDEIHLPTQVRNYTEKKQKVDVTMAKSEWFLFLKSDKQQINVDAGNSQNAIFGFKAISAIKDGKQRVTAIAAKDSDAIEKPVTVRPNGQEIVRTDSKLFYGTANFDVTFPANAMPGTQKAQLKIYPNLFSHVADSVEGLLQRPYGCGEQTISSTYPNLMVLKFVKPDSNLAKKARNFLQKGYERLLGYQVADGGFTYWGGKDTSDVALTAYALRFLNDARPQIEVDETAVKRAEDWLIRQQRADGSWAKKYYYETADDAKRTKLFTAYVARILAMRAKHSDTAQHFPDEPLRKALDFLRSHSAEIDEPYVLALHGLALLDSGRADEAEAIAARLEKMAIAEEPAVYWNLETNTPFYGWGTAGRIETTALVTQLLTRVSRNDSKAKIGEPQSSDLISRATLFLLKNKDRYGVWYSTQTTINVLDAFLALLGGKDTGESQKLEVSINGEAAEVIDVAPDRIEPIIVELSGRLNAAQNKIEVRSSASASLMSQLVTSHYIDWRDADVSSSTVNGSRALRLDYKCDNMETAIMQEISCSVEAERIGFQGYGMLLAEIGTPPGADVSRESLQASMDADWSFSRYDILPDRIIIYMWAKAGGTRINFKFKPRYGINAQTPASVIYDYYNPEAQAIAEPLKFVVR